MGSLTEKFWSRDLQDECWRLVLAPERPCVICISGVSTLTIVYLVLIFTKDESHISLRVLPDSPLVLEYI